MVGHLSPTWQSGPKLSHPCSVTLPASTGCCPARRRPGGRAPASGSWPGRPPVAKARPIAYPLVRHTGQITQNNIAYTWKASRHEQLPDRHDRGLHRDHTVSRDRDRDLDRGRAAPNKIVQVQSLFWSPAGCRSTSTHPSPPRVSRSSSVSRASPRATSTCRNRGRDDLPERRSVHVGQNPACNRSSCRRPRAASVRSGVRLVDSWSDHGGRRHRASAADTDPGTGASTWSEVTCGTTVVRGGSVLDRSSTRGADRPGRRDGPSDSMTRPRAPRTCLSSADGRRSDGRRHARDRGSSRAGRSAVMTLDGTVAPLGSATLARILSTPAARTRRFPTGSNTRDGSVLADRRLRDGTEHHDPLLARSTSADSPRTFWPPCRGRVRTRGTATTRSWVHGRRDGAGRDKQQQHQRTPPPTAHRCRRQRLLLEWAFGYTPVSASSATPVACAPFDFTWPVGVHLVRIRMTGTTSPAVITPVTRQPPRRRRT